MGLFPLSASDARGRAQQVNTCVCSPIGTRKFDHAAPGTMVCRRHVQACLVQFWLLLVSVFDQGWPDVSQEWGRFRQRLRGASVPKFAKVPFGPRFQDDIRQHRSSLCKGRNTARKPPLAGSQRQALAEGKRGTCPWSRCARWGSAHAGPRFWTVSQTRANMGVRSSKRSEKWVSLHGSGQKSVQSEWRAETKLAKTLAGLLGPEMSTFVRTFEKSARTGHLEQI